MSSDDLKRLPVLTGSANYNRWKGPIEVYLKSQGLWKYVRDVQDLSKDDDEQKDSKAKVIIYSCLSSEIKSATASINSSIAKTI